MNSFIDLFAGCGGLSLGLSLAGLRGAFAIEKDSLAFDTFKANFLVPGPYQFEWPAWLQPAGNLGIDTLLEEHLDDLASLRDKITVIAGGPPCQGFSFAGRRDAADPRNQLFKKYVRVVHTIRPKVLILENVPGMRVAHSNAVAPGSSRKPRSFLEKLLARLKAIGYDCHSEVLDASNYGVPQRRTRLIVIGMRKDVADSVPGGAKRVFQVLERDRTSELAVLGLKVPVTAKQALSDLETRPGLLQPCTDPYSPPGFNEKVYGGPRSDFQTLMHLGHQGPMDSMRLARHSDRVRERFQQILDKCPKGVRMNEQHRESFKLLKHRIYPMAARIPGPTITTLPDDVLHYNEPRILTVRECARLQSFPDWFVFRGKFTTGGDRRTKECPRYTQVGNAVPPLLARALGRAILTTLEEADTTNHGLTSESKPTAVDVST